MVKINSSKVKSINKKHIDEILHKTIKRAKSQTHESVAKTLKKNVAKTKGKDKDSLKPLVAIDFNKDQVNVIKDKGKLKSSISKADGLNNGDPKDISKSSNDKKRKAAKVISTVDKKKKLKKGVTQAETDGKTDNVVILNNVKVVQEKKENNELLRQKKEMEKSKLKIKIQQKKINKVKGTSSNIEHLEKKAKKQVKKVKTNPDVAIDQLTHKEDVLKNSESIKEETKSEDAILEENIINIELKDEIKFKDAKVEALTEEAFDSILHVTKIQDICKAFETLLKGEINEMKNLVINDYRYMLNVTSYKIPNCPKRMVKLNLKHSLVDLDKDDVVLIVADLKRGAKVDYEPTIQYYQDLLQEAGISRNLKIRPFTQIRNECKTFEAKRKFANSFDYFMCDGRIVSHVNGFCGKVLQKPRTTLHAVRMNKLKYIKREIEHSLQRTAYRQLQKGDLIAIPVGHSRLTIEELADNITFVIDQLKKLYPGGYENMRHIYLRADIRGTSAIPLFINLAEPPKKTPQVVGAKEKRLLRMKGKVNKILTKFNVTKSANVAKLNNAAIKKKMLNSALKVIKT